MSDRQQLQLLSVGSNPVLAFLSWRLATSNTSDLSLVCTGQSVSYDSVATYGISFKSTRFGDERLRPMAVYPSTAHASQQGSRGAYDLILIHIADIDLDDSQSLVDLLRPIITPGRTCVIVNTTFTAALDMQPAFDGFFAAFPQNPVLCMTCNARLAQPDLRKAEYILVGDEATFSFVNRDTGPPLSAELIESAVDDAGYAVANGYDPDPQMVKLLADIYTSVKVSLEMAGVQCEWDQDLARKQWANILMPSALYPVACLTNNLFDIAESIGLSSSEEDRASSSNKSGSSSSGAGDDILQTRPSKNLYKSSRNLRNLVQNIVYEVAAIANACGAKLDRNFVDSCLETEIERLKLNKPMHPFLKPCVSGLRRSRSPLLLLDYVAFQPDELSAVLRGPIGMGKALGLPINWLEPIFVLISSTATIISPSSSSTSLASSFQQSYGASTPNGYGNNNGYPVPVGPIANGSVPDGAYYGSNQYDANNPNSRLSRPASMMNIGYGQQQQQQQQQQQAPGQRYRYFNQNPAKPTRANGPPPMNSSFVPNGPPNAMRRNPSQVFEQNGYDMRSPPVAGAVQRPGTSLGMVGGAGRMNGIAPRSPQASYGAEYTETDVMGASMAPGKPVDMLAMTSRRVKRLTGPPMELRQQIMMNGDPPRQMGYGNRPGSRMGHPGAPMPMQNGDYSNNGYNNNPEMDPSNGAQGPPFSRSYSQGGPFQQQAQANGGGGAYPGPPRRVASGPAYESVTNGNGYPVANKMDDLSINKPNGRPQDSSSGPNTPPNRSEGEAATGYGGGATTPQFDGPYNGGPSQSSPQQEQVSRQPAQQAAAAAPPPQQPQQALPRAPFTGGFAPAAKTSPKTEKKKKGFGGLFGKKKDKVSTEALTAGTNH